MTAASKARQNGKVEEPKPPRLFKLIITPVFADRDDKGEIVREMSPPDPVIFYRPDIPSLPEKLMELEAQLQLQSQASA